MASRLPWPNWTAALLALENTSVAGFRLFCVRPRVRATVSSEPWRAAARPFAAIPEVVGFDWIASNMDVILAPKKTPRRPDWRRHAAVQHSTELVFERPHYKRIVHCDNFGPYLLSTRSEDGLSL